MLDPNAFAVRESKRSVPADRDDSTAHVGFFIWDEVLDRPIYLSEEIAAIHGYTVEESLARYTSNDKIAAEMTPEDGRRYLDLIERCKVTGETYEVEYRVHRRDGQQRDIREVGEFLRNSEGKVVQSLGALVDITPQKLIEAAFRNEEKRLRHIFESAPVPIFEENWSDLRSYLQSLKQSGVSSFREYFSQNPGELARIPHLIKWIDANRAAAHLYGFGSANELAKYFRAIPKDDFENEPAIYDAFFAGKREAFLENTEILSDGRRADFIQTFRLPEGEGEDWTRVVICVQDVSSLKRVSAELAVARDQAQAANEAKSMFLATMSHEIRTPLNGIVGMAYLLATTKLDQYQSEYCQTITQSAHALLSIINDILDFSKIEAGRLDVEFIEFDLREIVESAVELCAPKASEKKLALVCSVDPALPSRVNGDPNRVRQVLLNLLNNAVKFTEHGEVLLSVTLVPGEAQGTVGSAIGFSVRDTGIGIAPDKLDRLFQSFSQVDASTTRRHGGTGLGLAISQRLSTLMGGLITVKSEVGKGSEFSLTLPLQAVDQQPEMLAERTDRFAGEVFGIVDDNSTNRRVIEIATSSWGLSPRLFSSASEMIDFVEQGGKLDAAIVDFSMPLMDGIDLAARLRQISDGSIGPMILATSLDQFEMRQAERTRQLFDATISKPIKLSALLQILFRLLRHRAPNQADEPSPVEAKSDATFAERRPLRLLLVDDNTTNLVVCSALLRRLGYDATCTSSGRAALLELEAAAEPYDAVLMDVEMPELDGLETMRLIRALPGLPIPRIVALTANAISGDRERYIAQGMDDYIAKPMAITELRATLERTYAWKSGND